MQRNAVTSAEPRAAHDGGHPLAAIGLMCVAVTLFSALDTAAKVLVARRGLPVAEVVWMRFLGQIAYMLVLWWVLRVPSLIATRRPGMQLLRSFLMGGTTAFNFLALQYLRLDQTMTITFLTPLVVALLAGPLLGEWVGLRRMLAILAGFCGILIAVRPGVAHVHWAVLYSLAGMLIYAGFLIVTRLIAAGEAPFVTLFYSMLVGAVGCAPFALHEWVWPAGLVDWLLAMSLGALGGAGHFLLILAHNRAPASTIAPFLYLQLLSMVGLGYLVFGDVPDVYTLAGALVVVASGVYLLHRQRMQAREQVLGSRG
jgi:drug/metabolite transporter (DMT)-like permease